MKKKILVSTGGSGGHVIPATIIYEHLKNEFDVLLTIDKRGIKFINLQKYNFTIIDTPKITKNFLKLPVIFFCFILLTIKSFIFLKKKNIDILISTGGYMSLPLVVAAKILNKKIYLFEPNMVIGRANNFFLKYSKKIFCYSDEIINFPKKYINKIELIDHLLRKEFYLIKKNNKIYLNEEIKLLIIGGSQGAKLFDNELKKTIIDISKKYKLKVFHQVASLKKNDLENFYKENKIHHNLFSFEENILNIINDTNLCITRAGASTLAELVFLNVPFIAIPYPLAKDDHQFQNAEFYKKRDSCWMLKQDEIKDKVLTNYLLNIIEDKNDYLTKEKNMKKISYQNTWNKINQKLVRTINEN